MGSQGRKAYKRELERVISNLEWALTHLARVVDAYEQDHPDISQAAETIGHGIAIAADATQKLNERI
jgi:hypothetical protein